MAREQASRKWLATINNPLEHGSPHEQIRKNLSEIKLEYWCMCDEVGEQGTPHTHIYLVAKNAINLSTLKKRLPAAHLDMAKGTSQQNRDYIRKEGAYQDDAKKETNRPETFEEWGVMPIERQGTINQSEEVLQMIRDGYDDIAILERFPSWIPKLNAIEQARQRFREAEYGNKRRELDVWYIYGDTGVGKTRGVLDKYGYPNVYHVTNYAHPFDQYKGQKVMLFDEFRSSLPFAEMLSYLDGYPILLPCRYQGRTACYDTVYIISNIPLEEQYTYMQVKEPESWEAFCRRINHVEHMERDFIEL